LVWAPIVGEWYERVNNAGAVEHRHYVRSSERVVAVVTKSSAVTKTQYLHTDHAGSVDVVSTGTGALDERRSYDPFGARRNPDWGTTPPVYRSGAWRVIDFLAFATRPHFLSPEARVWGVANAKKSSLDKRNERSGRLLSIHHARPDIRR
jgi:hypothetical protein